MILRWLAKEDSEGEAALVVGESEGKMVGQSRSIWAWMRCERSRMPCKSVAGTCGDAGAHGTCGGHGGREGYTEYAKTHELELSR